VLCRFDEKTPTWKIVVFQAQTIILIPCQRPKRLGRMRPRINFRKVGPTSSRQAHISKTIIFAHRNDSRFWSAVF
jgi:hypothetical protein